MRLVKICLIVALCLTHYGVRSDDDKKEEEPAAEEAGGTTAVSSDFDCFPEAVVSVRRRLGETGQTEHLCAGILLNAYWVLTVADMIYHISGAEIVLAFGVTIGKDVNNYTGKVFDIDFMHRNKHFNFLNLQNNLLLLHTNHKLESFRYAAIPTQLVPMDIEDDCNDEIYTPLYDDEYKLECHEVEETNHGVCKRKYRFNRVFKLNLKEHTCVDNPKGKFWNGNKGLPLICDGIYYAFVTYKGSTDFPTVYTRIDRHLNFIKETINVMYPRFKKIKFYSSTGQRIYFNPMLIMIVLINKIFQI